MRIEVKDLVDEKFPKTNRGTVRNANISSFAKSIDVTVDAARKIYDGSTSSISFKTLQNICISLNCTPNDIFVLEESN